MTVKNTVKNTAYRVKHTLDPGLTDSQVIKRLFASLFLLIYSWFFMAGIIVGAYIKTTAGRTPSMFLMELWDVEYELWMDLATEPVLVKAIGVFGWFLGIVAIVVSEIGFHIGYALPNAVINVILQPAVTNTVGWIVMGIVTLLSAFYFADFVYRSGKEINELVARYTQ